MPGFTGSGAAITFGTTSFTAAVRSISEMDVEIEIIDSTVLGTAAADEATAIPGDNPDPSEVTVTTRFSGTQAQPAIRSTNLAETITITLPKEVAASTSAANIAGSGFLTAFRKLPALGRNQLNEGMLRFKWDGVTGPTYTAEA